MLCTPRGALLVREIPRTAHRDGARTVAEWGNTAEKSQARAGGL